jgi:hypothetical protein
MTKNIINETTGKIEEVLDLASLHISEEGCRRQWKSRRVVDSYAVAPRRMIKVKISPIAEVERYYE